MRAALHQVLRPQLLQYTSTPWPQSMHRRTPLQFCPPWLQRASARLMRRRRRAASQGQSLGRAMRQAQAWAAAQELVQPPQCPALLTGWASTGWAGHQLVRWAR